MDLILYHDHCPDGWTAAYICKKKYPEAELVALNHGLDGTAIDALITKCEGKDVLMVDYSLRTRQDNDELNRAAKSFRILDHHKSAREVLEGAEYATFDMKRSGAGLGWDYLFGKDSTGEWTYDREQREGGVDLGTPRPWWVNYVEDQDLWNWALPNSQVINAWLMVQPRTVEKWDDIASHKFSAVEAEKLGRGTRDYIEYYTKNVVADLQKGVLRVQTGTIESEDGIVTVPVYTDYRTAVLNIPYSGVSEAGNAAVKQGYEIALLWFERGDGQTQFSLRSNKEAEGGGVDVSAIAKLYGGGGHRNASGFQMEYSRARLLVDVILGRASYVPGTCMR